MTTTHPTIPRALLDRAISEKAFQAQVIQLAELNGWMCHHEYDSRRSTPGMPDLVLLHPAGYLHIAEIKTERGRLSAAQKVWLKAFRLVHAIMAVYSVPDRYFGVHVWRPRDWAEIERVLSEPQRNRVVWCNPDPGKAR